MKLVIAEKPSVGKEIADVIGATKMVNLLSVAVILNVNMFKGTKKECRETEELCSQCGSVLIERNRRFGKFIACSNYPKCKYIKRDRQINCAFYFCWRN